MRLLENFCKIIHSVSPEFTTSNTYNLCLSVVISSDFVSFAEPPFSDEEIHAIAKGIHTFAFDSSALMGPHFDIRFSSAHTGLNETVELFEFAKEVSGDFLVECHARFESMIQVDSVDEIFLQRFAEYLLAIAIRYRSCEDTGMHFPVSHVQMLSLAAPRATADPTQGSHLCADIISLLSEYDTSK